MRQGGRTDTDSCSLRAGQSLPESDEAMLQGAQHDGVLAQSVEPSAAGWRRRRVWRCPRPRGASGRAAAAGHPAGRGGPAGGAGAAGAGPGSDGDLGDLVVECYTDLGATRVGRAGRAFGLIVHGLRPTRHVEVKGSTVLPLAAAELTVNEVAHAANIR
jgi:hypothetical protein